MKPRDPDTYTAHGPAAEPVGADAPEHHGLRVRETVSNYPPVSTWDDVVMYDAKAHPRKVERHYMLVPTTCFNCESACGLLAYVDKETKESSRSRATQPTRVRADATAPRARPRSTRPPTLSASSPR